jgi:hypothetical protein
MTITLQSPTGAEMRSKGIDGKPAEDAQRRLTLREIYERNRKERDLLSRGQGRRNGATNIMNAVKQEHDPDGLPTNNRQMSKQADEITPTSSGITPTSPNALSGKPSGFMVGSTAPGASEAPQIAVEGPRAARGNDVKEYKQPGHDLPETISAREIANDRSNPDGCQSFEVQR